MHPHPSRPRTLPRRRRPGPTPPPAEPAAGGAAALRNLALLLTALCLVPAGAHLAALPGKLRLPAEAYLAAQRAYDGWALFGALLVVTITLDLAYALRLRRLGGRWRRALAAPLLLALGLALFLTITLPVNQATANWTALPEGWETLRARWEWSHAANAVLTFGALLALVLSLPATNPEELPPP